MRALPVVIIVICALVNVPFMLNGNAYSWANFISFGFCLGMAVSMTIQVVINR